MQALLDHMFYHDNTAPFISHRLIQRFTTSNPSPRYVRTVAKAFKTGTHGGKIFSGRYGDLAATLAAILLDREARSSILDLDPHHGRLREPILKVLHLLRSLGYRSKHDNEVELSNLLYLIGQAPYQSPTVFNFYLPEYSPMGPIGDSQLVSPEAELATTPHILQTLNGMFSLVSNGLTSCSGGFGSTAIQRNCGCTSAEDCNRRTTASGELSFSPSSADPVETVAELDLLLTAGRLNLHNRKIIEAQYTAALTDTTITGTSGSRDDAVRVATQLILSTAEFHSTQANVLTGQYRSDLNQVVSQNRPYKAVVVIYLGGGADTWNLLVPHSNCAVKDMYDEYDSVRTDAALPKSQLLPITVPHGTQPCNTFGLHPKLPYIQGLYEDGDASFFANIGILIEPLTSAEFYSKTKQIPRGLFGHNTQVDQVQALHPQDLNAKGVLGRMLGALSSQDQPYKTVSYSISGSQKIMHGPIAARIIGRKNGAIRLLAYDNPEEGKLGTALLNISRTESSSIFAETWAALLEASIKTNERLGEMLDPVTVTETFDDRSTLCEELQQVARLISLSQVCFTQSL